MQSESNAVMIESSYSNSVWSPEIHETLNFDTVTYTSPFENDEPSLEECDLESEDFEHSLIDSIFPNELGCWPIDISTDYQFSDIVNEVIFEDGDFSMTSLEFSGDEKDEVRPEKTESVVPDISSISNERFKDAVQCLMDRKFWSKRNSSERSLTLNAISFLFTHHLSIKNQIDVITILNPKIHFTPEDKEFSIHASDINDLKLWKIREFMKKNVPKIKDLGSQSPKKSVAPSTESSRKSNSKLTKRKGNLNFPRTKRKPRQPKSKKRELNSKLACQTEKEMRSGFFVYEKKLKLCTSSTEEDEDINVLE